MIIISHFHIGNTILPLGIVVAMVALSSSHAQNANPDTPHPTSILIKPLRLAALLLLSVLGGGNVRAEAPWSSSLLLQPNPTPSGTPLNSYTGRSVWKTL